MNLNFKNCFVVIFLLIPVIESAHIVFFSNVASYSHRVTTYPLADALAKRGHEVTFINPFRHRGPHINPNITELVPVAFEKYMNDWLSADFDINHRVNNTFQRLVFALFPPAIESCQHFLDSPELAEFYKNTKSVDLVILDNCMAECGVALAYKYGAKHMVFHTVTHWGHEFDLWGFDPESSAVPAYEIRPPTLPMTFWERVVNTLTGLHFRWHHYQFMTALDTMVRKHLNDPMMPFLDDLMRNISLALYVGDVVTDRVRSQPPLFVNIGGIYCKNETDPLPTEVTAFIKADPKADGLVYISLGSLAISSNLPDSVIQVFFATIRRLPKLRFIWKWDSPIPADKPENLYLAKWLPQMDLLAHPKMKAFVTQCGRPSTLEALCSAVPMISFPVLGDQDNNANRMNEMGGNVKLELGTVTSDEFVEALQKVVNNSKFKERLVELRSILLDRPVPPMETAVWWTEYVLRHNDTRHLRPAGFGQWWFQRRLLDVWAFVFTVLLASLAIILISIIKLLNCLCRSKTKKNETKRKIKKT